MRDPNRIIVRINGKTFLRVKKRKKSLREITKKKSDNFRGVGIQTSNLRKARNF